MAYHIYTTDGFVLKSVPSGEADKFFFIVTRDLGLIVATAKSVRKVGSKLSNGLEDFSRSLFSFVRGRHAWKVTSVKPHFNSYRKIQGDKQKQLLWVRILSLVRRLVKGEEKHEEIFLLLENLFSHLSLRRYSDAELLAIESITILELLSLLGYMNIREEYRSFLPLQSFSDENTNKANKLQKIILIDINHALGASQL